MTVLFKSKRLLGCLNVLAAVVLAVLAAVTAKFLPVLPPFCLLLLPSSNSLAVIVAVWDDGTMRNKLLLIRCFVLLKYLRLPPSTEVVFSFLTSDDKEILPLPVESCCY